MCLSLIKSTLCPNLVISTFETSVEFVIFFLFLQPQHLQIHLSPANLTTAIHFTLASHKRISTNFNAFKTHYKHFKISTHHTDTETTTLASNQTKNRVQTLSFNIKNTHKSTIYIRTFICRIVFHFRHILFLRDLLIHSFFPFHMSDHHLAKGLSLSLVHDFGIHYLHLIPEI